MQKCEYYTDRTVRGGMRQMKASELMAKIKEHGITVDQMAEQLGIDKATFYRKLQRPNNSFSVEQARKIALMLKMTNEEVNRIFFDL